MLVNTLLKNQDNAELIRDRIVLILASELANQYALALAYTPEPEEDFNAEDYKITVYMESLRPMDQMDLPAVNVQLLASNKDERPGSTVGNQKNKIHFAIDCTARGKMDGAADDADATVRCWFVSRLVRSILMAGEDTYLGLRGIVQKREVISRTTGDLQNINESAAVISVCRILFDVDTYEGSPQAAYQSFEGMSFKVETADGRIILADLATPPYKDEEE